ncbi:MAG TPA: ABC transporter permease subunit [Candidatus Acidoferrales bacterium]|nr:ABC transporter permease subunit [Candidatus Acidoferrales bacterium]
MSRRGVVRAVLPKGTHQGAAPRRLPTHGGGNAARTTGSRPGTFLSARLRSHVGSVAFLAPAAIWLLLITVYPLFATVRNSFYDATVTDYVGLRNYQAVFSTATILLTFRNNVIWVVVFPFIVTFIGLVFAVLLERIRWSTAFKTIVFMPIVFSATASALVWRTIFDLDPHVGVVNATIQTAADMVSPPGLYPVDASAGQSAADLASTGVTPGPAGTLQSSSAVGSGGTVELGLVGISQSALELVQAKTAIGPTSSDGSITGLVWRDFSPSDPNVRGQVLPGELGVPGLKLTLLRADGSSAGTTTTDAHGEFRFADVGIGTFRVQIDASNFRAGFSGIFWLGTQSITPTANLNQTARAVLSIPLVDLSMIVAYLWIFAGFAMVVIGAGMSALDREVLEAARIDGANEWQVFRRVTVPMLAPVLAVVFVTMLINVLKIFDIVLNMAPGSSQEDANTLALAMYNYAFTGLGNWGLASAIAVVLFVLVIPAILFNLRRIRG